LEPRARVSVWPRRRNVPGIVAPEPWGARGAECLPRDVLRRSSSATSSRDGTTARRCLCHRTGSGTTEAHPPPESSVPPAPHGGLGVYRATRPIPGRIFGAAAGFRAARISIQVVSNGTKTFGLTGHLGNVGLIILDAAVLSRPPPSPAPHLRESGEFHAAEPAFLAESRGPPQ